MAGGSAALVWAAAVCFLCMGVGVSGQAPTLGAPLSNITHGKVSFGGATQRVAMQVISPFVMQDTTKVGNAAFSGFTVDLLNALEDELDVEFEYFVASEAEKESSAKALELVGAGKALGDPLEAHVAAGAIHITASRSKDVNFALPYYFLGYALVVKAPASVPNPLTFLLPFHDLLWVGIIIEMLIVGIVFYLMESPALGNDDTDLVGGKLLSIVDAVYWSISALTCTLDKAPKTWGGKVVMLGHGWFMLIIISAYTANLASFLTVSAQTPTITSFTQVAESKGTYRLALPKGQSHETFINFEIGHYGYKFDVTWLNTWEECMTAVRNGDVDATFEDQPVVEYYLAQTIDDPCALMTVGPTFGPVGYGLAFSSSNTDFIPYSQAIVHLQELGELSKLAKKYGIGPNAVAPVCGGNTSGSFYIEEMWGLIAMTGVFIGIGIIVAIVEKFSKGKEDASVVPSGDTNKPALDGNIERYIQAGIQAGVEQALKMKQADDAGGATQPMAEGPSTSVEGSGFGNGSAAQAVASVGGEGVREPTRLVVGEGVEMSRLSTRHVDSIA
mmetsp:Transcript_11455/g.28482  ORF Transcript_11455/g.28482 Transcript_11455/m.28482 type:complete len:559 (-) Transcript_11455:106-1782(-)|eukprot:CAMPEP_0173420172 /NCGR_PEP_ID=MMETSP1357-20121228/1767_1 /TAXON_ID=77926 /ORGANISM="Hemiselmis rufescens, Strain PCC563" /LENGTH=558 /DNA_ID=CAMNT_0014382939 /DNA_START=104 /DNA_END=1780 /DNA_ORIENTATION=-